MQQCNKNISFLCQKIIESGNNFIATENIFINRLPDVKNVILANLSFTEKEQLYKKKLDCWLTPDTAEVRYCDYNSDEQDKNLFQESLGFPKNYFPEWHLSKWFF